MGVVVGYTHETHSLFGYFNDGNKAENVFLFQYFVRSYERNPKHSVQSLIIIKKKNDRTR